MSSAPKRPLRLDDGRVVIASRDAEGNVWVDVVGRETQTLRYAATNPAETSPASAGPAQSASSDPTLRAASGGRIERVSVAAGDEVATGDAMVTLELMKMRLEIAAPRAGHVDAVHVAVGDVVSRGDALVTLRAPE